MLAQAPLLSLALVASTAALVAGHAPAPGVHHFKKRMLDISGVDGVVNHDFLTNDQTRSSSKYAKGQKNYKINFSLAHSNSTARKRHESTLEMARELERRSLLVEAGVEGEGLSKRAPKGSIELTDYFSGGHDAMYFGPMTFAGNQVFDIDFDTGSADLWIPSPTSNSKHRHFSIAKSSTIETSTAAWDITYGSGSSRGYLARDTVSMGGYTISKQIFALADQTAPVIEALPSDGLCGMAFSTIATSGAPTPFENLISQGAVSNPVFGVYLQRASDLTSKSSGQIGGGELCIGCINSAHYTGEINYVPVATKGYWEVPSEGIAIDGAVVPGTSFKAAIDTGTTLIYIPHSAAVALYKKIGGTERGSTGEFVVPCASTFSTIALSFGGVQYQMPLSDLFLGYASAASKSECVLGIFGIDQYDAEGNVVAIVGDLFLKAVYSVYSYSQNGNPAVGFATSATSGVTTSSSSSSSASSSSSSASGSSSGSGSGSAANPAAPVYVPTAVAQVSIEPVATVSAYDADNAPAVKIAAPSGASGSVSSVAEGEGEGGQVAGGFTFTVFSTPVVATDAAAATSPSSATSSSSSSASSNGNAAESAQAAIVTQTATLTSPESDPSSPSSSDGGGETTTSAAGRSSAPFFGTLALVGIAALLI